MLSWYAGTSTRIIEASEGRTRDSAVSYYRCIGHCELYRRAVPHNEGMVEEHLVLLVLAHMNPHRFTDLYLDTGEEDEGQCGRILMLYRNSGLCERSPHHAMGKVTS